MLQWQKSVKQGDYTVAYMLITQKSGLIFTVLIPLSGSAGSGGKSQIKSYSVVRGSNLRLMTAVALTLVTLPDTRN